MNENQDFWRGVRQGAREAADTVELMCHWKQDRGDSREQTHAEFHFGFCCPYEAMAAVLRGEPDPRDQRSAADRSDGRPPSFYRNEKRMNNSTELATPATLRQPRGIITADWCRQNGIEHTAIPWDQLDVIFLGGSAECLPCDRVRPSTDFATVTCLGCHRRLTEWKEGVSARALTAEAKRRGKHVHMGRVNSGRRYRYARLIGCDSVDGTTLAKYPDATLPDVLSWVHGSTQGLLEVS